MFNWIGKIIKKIKLKLRRRKILKKLKKKDPYVYK